MHSAFLMKISIKKFDFWYSLAIFFQNAKEIFYQIIFFLFFLHLA